MNKQKKNPLRPAGTASESGEEEWESLNLKFDHLLSDVCKQISKRKNEQLFDLDRMDEEAIEARATYEIQIPVGIKSPKEGASCTHTYHYVSSSQSQTKSNQRGRLSPEMVSRIRELSGKPKIDYFPCNSPESKRRLHYLYQPLEESERPGKKKRNKRKKRTSRQYQK